MVRPVTKEIKRNDVNGNTVNFGPLVMGVTGGIQCLGRRESLISLGINLLDKKPPVYFVSSMYLVVSVSDRLRATVYAVEGCQFDTLGKRISDKGYAVVAKTRFHNRSSLKAWEKGKLLYDNQEPLKSSKVKRVTGYQKCILLLRRLLGNRSAV